MKPTSSRLSILFACGAAASGLAACGTTEDADPAIDNSDPTTQPTQPAQPTGGDVTATASSLPECKAQRAVYLVGGVGGLAWFSLVWPAPAVITGFQSTYAYDDPAKAQDLTAMAAHPLFARKIGVRTVWEGRGGNPEPTVLVAGTNETHINAPTSIFNSTATNLAGQAAAIQTTLPSTIPVLTFSVAGPYIAVPGAPLAINTATVDTAIAAFTGRITAAQQAALQPTADQIARYVPVGATTAETDFGNQLAFSANAFKLGLINTIMIPAFRDDPHNAFAAGTAGPRADHLAATLDAFYTDLAAANEPSCSHTGQTIKLADNVVTIVDGDTPKSSFNQNGWHAGQLELAVPAVERLHQAGLVRRHRGHAAGQLQPDDRPDRRHRDAGAGHRGDLRRRALRDRARRQGPGRHGHDRAVRRRDQVTAWRSARPRGA